MGQSAARIGFRLASDRPMGGGATLAEGAMKSRVGLIADEAGAERLRGLARRCRELAEMTAVPDLPRKLFSIARELAHEAELPRA